VIAIQGLNVWLLIAIAGKVDMWVCYDIRKAGFQRLQELSFSYFDKTPVGWLMARMTSDTERLADTLAWGIVDLVWGFTMMISITGIMLYLNWKLALVVLAVVPLLVWVSGKFQVLILRSYREVRKTNSKITGAFNEGISGAKTTKTLVREEANLQEFSHLTKNMFRSSFIAAVQSSLYLPLVLIIGMVGSGLALWFGGDGVVGGAITYGMLVAFIS
ncbi:MAG: ABC transporter ATP-binding protein, partial [Planctomycetes bacterium]|nr:ABC transporter ATP-binding protein [Planctomycetota bacterium]